MDRLRHRVHRVAGDHGRDLRRRCDRRPRHQRNSTLDGSGTPQETAALAKTETLNAGATATVTANLKPGRYELVCLEPGHYAAGQHTSFTVTG
jgi:uncharacterized cupredoxin-like copper-binding protein